MPTERRLKALAAVLFGLNVMLLAGCGSEVARTTSPSGKVEAVLEERATLMRLLIDTLDAESEEGSEDAWRTEVERRVAKLDAGAVEPTPWEELRARLYQR